MKTSSSRKLSPQATLSGLLVALFLLIMASTPGFATLYDSTWTGASGSWFTDSNWSPNPPGHPDNNKSPYTNTYNVTIPNNPSTVSLDGYYTMNRLTVDPGATILTASGASRSIQIGSGGTITNNGTINLTPSGNNFAEIIGSFNYDLTINGSGTIILGKSKSQIRFESGLRTLTNDTYQTIQGGGNIGGAGMYQFVNNGTVFANSSSGMLLKMASGGSPSYPGLNNQGTLRVASGSYLEIQGNFQNYSSSTSTLTGGTYWVQGYGHMIFPLGPILHNKATVILDGVGSTIGTTVFNQLQSNEPAGSPAGSLTVKNGAQFNTSGAFQNAGVLSVGMNSRFKTNGDFTQTSAGLLNFDILNTGQSFVPGVGNLFNYGQLNVTGTANLDGELDITLLTGYTVNPGDIFDLFNYSSHSGTFSSIKEIGGDGKLIFTPNYGATGLYVTASNVPLPGAVWLLGSGLLGLLGLRRKFKG